MSETHQKQYGNDYATTILKKLSEDIASPTGVDHLLQSIHKSNDQFYIHHENIADVVYGIDDKSIDILRKNCDLIEQSSYCENYSDHENKDMKFISSIRLSITQRAFILSNVKLAGIEAKEIEDTKSHIYTDIVSVLGIFSALMFALFGGVSMITQSISGITNGIRLSRIILMLSLVSTALMVLIFLLLNGISGMVGKQMKVCCDSKDCGHTPFEKYPFFVVGIMSYLFLAGISCLMIPLDYHKLIYVHPIISSLVFVFIFLALMGLLYYILFRKHQEQKNTK